MQIDKQEIEKIAQFLMSELPENVELGFQLIKRRKAIVLALTTPLAILAFLHPEKKTRTRASGYLNRNLPEDIFVQHETELEVLRTVREQNWVFFTDRAQRGQENRDLLLYESAAGRYEPYLAMNKTYVKLLLKLGRSIEQYLRGAYDKAIEYYQKVIHYAPDLGEGHFRLAAAIHENYLLKGKALDRAQEAIDGYKKAFEIHPHNLSCLSNLGGLYQHVLQDMKQAKTCYRELIKKDPHDPEPYNELAWILAMYDHNYEEGKQLALKSLSLDHFDYNAMDTLGHIELHGYNNLEKAEEYFHQALNEESDHSYSIMGLGDLQKAKGNYSKAFDLYLEALAKDEENEDLLCRLARFCWEIDKNKKQALKYCKKALELSPNKRDAQKLLAELRDV